jgi:hypothetical protein
VTFVRSGLPAVFLAVWLGTLLGGQAGCSVANRGVGSPDAGAADAAADSDGSAGADGSLCQAPAMPAGPEVQLAPPFVGLYHVYALGSVPGVPSPLGGVMVKHGDPSTLLVAGSSEQTNGAIYAIHVTRDGCGHILAFDGTATKVADTPYVDANLVDGPQSLIVYSEWPQYTLSQLPAGTAMPARRTDLRPLGLTSTNDSGPGGIAFVPPGLTAAGQLRLVTWPAGHWVHAGATLTSGLYTIGSITEVLQLPNNPGGFAYVPAGSPGFDKQSIIVAEWRQDDATQDRVAVYDADANGDPVLSTRREFLAKFPRPWGAYFEPVTGDYLFLTWGAGDDRVYIVQGFVPPPPIF